MKAVGYVRINKNRDQPKQFEVEVQVQIIEEYVKKKGWELDSILKDLVPDSDDMKHPSMISLVQKAIDNEFDVLVLPRLDRLTRNIRYFTHLLDNVFKPNGIEIVSLDEGLESFTKRGKLAIDILNIVTKWEKKKISDRTKEMIEKKRLIGETVGHAPFGFKYHNKRLVMIEDEMQVVRLILKERELGGSFHGIARSLNERGIRAKRGGKWYAETIKSICLNELYRRYVE